MNFYGQSKNDKFFAQNRAKEYSDLSKGDYGKVLYSYSFFLCYYKQGCGVGVVRSRVVLVELEFQGGGVENWSFKESDLKI